MSELWMIRVWPGHANSSFGYSTAVIQTLIPTDIIAALSQKIIHSLALGLRVTLLGLSKFKNTSEMSERRTGIMWVPTNPSPLVTTPSIKNHMDTPIRLPTAMLTINVFKFIIFIYLR
jgi:hypothetical protein